MQLILSALFVVSLALLGLWLIKVTRSISRVATIMNELDVKLDFLGFQRRPNAVLLFSDIWFIKWLVTRKYDGTGLPIEVISALDEARKSYLLVAVVFSLAVVLVVLMVLDSLATS